MWGWGSSSNDRKQWDPLDPAERSAAFNASLASPNRKLPTATDETARREALQVWVCPKNVLPLNVSVACDTCTHHGPAAACCKSVSEHAAPEGQLLLPQKHKATSRS